MGSFKEMLREDIKEIFMDLEMFGETHIVAGKEHLIVTRHNQYNLQHLALYQGEE